MTEKNKRDKEAEAEAKRRFIIIVFAFIILNSVVFPLISWQGIVALFSLEILALDLLASYWGIEDFKKSLYAVFDYI